MILFLRETETQKNYQISRIDQYSRGTYIRRQRQDSERERENEIESVCESDRYRDKVYLFFNSSEIGRIRD